MSESTEASTSGKRANAALGDRRDAIVAAVESAKAKVAERKAGEQPSLGEKRDLKSIDRPAISEKVDEALGKSRDEAVEVVEAAKETLSAEVPATPTEPAPPAEDSLKEGRLYADLRAKEKRLVDGQQRLRKEREEFDTYRHRVETELADARESNTLAKQDPFAWFERYHGIKRAAFGVAGQGTDPAPSVGLEQANVRIAQLEHALTQRNAHDELRAREAARERELAQFASEAKAGEKRWPLSSRYSADKLKARGYEIALASAKAGAILSNDEVLDRIEEELSEIASLRAPKSPAPAPKSPESRSEAKPSEQPTLTSRGTTDAAPVPRLPSKMKHSDMIRETVRVLDELRAKGQKV